MTTPIIPRETLLAARTAMQPGRRNWEKLIAQRNDRKLIGVGLGASTWEGSITTYFRNQLQTQLEKMLQTSYNPLGVGGGYSLKVRNSDTDAWAKTGTTGGIDDLDTKKIATLAAGATATHTTYGTSTGIDIMYPEGPSCGAFQVQIDGGTATTITPGSTAGYTAKWSSPVLTRAQHTYKITAVGDAQLGLAYIRDQDENYGVRLYNFGRAGAATTQFVDSTADSTWARITSLAPDFFVVMLGHNNLGATTVAQMQTDLGTIASRAAAIDSTKTIPLLVIAQHSTDSRWPAYHDGIGQFAAGQPNAMFATYYDFFAKDTTAAAASGEFYTDNLHLKDDGHRMGAQFVADQWQLPSRKTWTVTP